MSKCPFWSTGKMRVKCYDECPMYPDPKGYEVCPFKEYLDSANINIKDNIDTIYIIFCIYSKCI